jgi:hypothetical protein
MEALKNEIEHLPDHEKTALAVWINRQDWLAWDRQIEEDFSEGGAGMPFIAQWDAEIRTGHSVPLEELLGLRNDRPIE